MTTDSNNRLRILVVDDEVDTADSLALVLNLWGHEAQAVYSGHQALNAIRTLRPDVVLLDLQMPLMHGGEVAARLRLSLLDVVIIATTATDEYDAQLEPYRYLFNGYLRKPFDPVELSSMMAQTQR